MADINIISWTYGKEVLIVAKRNPVQPQRLIAETIKMADRIEFDTEMFRKGLEIRREVLGDEYVNKSLAGADDLTAPLQKLLTEYCWGEVWSRPGLERKTRSFLNLAWLIALNRPHELRLHLAVAISNGVTKSEIVEVILQAALYCGAPAALDAMRLAKEVVTEIEKDREVT